MANVDLGRRELTLQSIDPNLARTVVVSYEQLCIGTGLEMRTIPDGPRPCWTVDCIVDGGPSTFEDLYVEDGGENGSSLREDDVPSNGSALDGPANAAVLPTTMTRIVDEVAPGAAGSFDEDPSSQIRLVTTKARQHRFEAADGVNRQRARGAAGRCFLGQTRRAMGLARCTITEETRGTP